MNNHSTLDLKAPKIKGGVATDQRHDSAHKHVTGQAIYIDDMPEPAGTLHGCLGLSTVAHGTVHEIDVSAVRKPPAWSMCCWRATCPAKTTSAQPDGTTSRFLQTAKCSSSDSRSLR